MTAIWTLGELADAAQGRLLGVPRDTPVSGISIDTRTLQPGDAFFAIVGVSMDAHRFVPAALEAGACAAVVSHGEAERAVVVDDVLAALGRVGVAARARLAGGTPVVAVTGSVGKTGTKEMLRLAFESGGPVHASAASYNNHWGVPLSLARMPADVDAAIFEIGMNHAGEITPLTRMVRPTIAIITQVAAVHLEFFDSVAAIADAKAEIFAGLEDGGVAIIPADNDHTERMAAAARAAGAEVVLFGKGGDVSLVSLDAGGDAVADVFGETVYFELSDPAPHVANNALAVLAALSVAGWDIEAGAAALKAWSAPQGRGRRVRLRPAGGEAVLLDDWFNANPSSMGAAIATLGRVPAQRRIAILGDMRELGPTADDLHRGLAPLLVDADVRIVHTVGEMTKHLRDALPFELRGVHAATAGELVGQLPEVEPGDAVLVKGSKAIGLGAVVEAIEERYGLTDV
ncbi:UDP-N-acetylmuramoylalanyl-D-glutamyl-2, 6-diaminopimelate--D-alanyl-D-alanine ligase [Acuticoccus sediminis]|uniref:UDP-N-acetylmuramoyl-tripeptide--D-alanyl-D-alanine ligase n=1 Tax=Acuticoccus sediminis TaxID=2184697 RepID=A0A8B2NGV2_9HYPH|nr:UDP-N-acetylmuramoyl-tripeptide--D-alanyl-D-alanine ligase [Acuticoccus sediminis]RAH97055.1 UDP-N-acetylmuramoylalanyl-D-glutamyl-2, 6-diaminopimelate--D-alanyl-D-alanine ligase [Acuticoccus sediminis]